MKKTKFTDVIAGIYNSSKLTNFSVFILFAVFFTILLSSKYFLFQTIITPDGISKRDVIAKKDIEVTDVFKTEQQRKDVAQRISPILTPAEDSSIKNNLSVLEKSIWEIRTKNVPEDMKKTELSTLFDIKDNSRKQLILNYLLTAPKQDVDVIFKKASQTLEDILQAGVTEEDFNSNIDRIIFRNMKHDVPRNKISIISGILEQVIIPNLIVDERATMLAKQNAINSVKPVIVKFEKGSKIVFEGEPITKLKRDALNQAGYNVMEFNLLGFLSIFSLVGIGITTILYYLLFFDKTYLSKSYLTITASLSSFLAALVIALPEEFSTYILPFPAFAMLMTLFTNSKISIVTSTILLAIIGASMQFSMPEMIIFLITVIISAIAASRIKYARRVDLIKTGIEISLAITFLIGSSYLLQSGVNEIDIKDMQLNLGAGFINGILSGMIVLGVIPVLESIFKIITPYGLAEFGEHNHPLLKKLQEAPGTFSHSLMVSNLCEAAAEAIGADPILAKVGALYHDVGKLKRPLFFVENQTFFGVENPHHKYNPRFSKMIITAHTRDGLDLAKEYGIPPIIQDFIAQHHGESLAGHFYTQAVEMEGAENVAEEQFRYTGPKPNMKETAILMIADAVESASRTLKDYSENALENIINKIINDKLNDGQLSDSPLTLNDLKVISQVLNRNLRAAHHQRIKYHENIIEELEKKVKKTPRITSVEKITSSDRENKNENTKEKNQQENNNEN